MLKNWCFWIVVLEKTLESPLDSKEIILINPKGNQPWVFTERTDAEAEAPILWPPGAKSWLTGKDSDVGKDWGQKEKGTIEDEMVGWHLTQWTWVWVNSGSWWCTGRPGVLRFMGSQRVGHDWATGLNWIELIVKSVSLWRDKGWVYLFCHLALILTDFCSDLISFSHLTWFYFALLLLVSYSGH